MAGKSDFLENALLALIFNGTASATLFQNHVTSPLTNLYVSLHTADPTDSGVQNASEAAYVGYSRIAVARTTGGWTVSGSNPTQVAPVANIDFGQCSATPGSPITHFGIGVAASGATSLLYAGAVTPNITMAVGVIPRLTTASTITED